QCWDLHRHCDQEESDHRVGSDLRINAKPHQCEIPPHHGLAKSASRHTSPSALEGCASSGPVVEHKNNGNSTDWWTNPGSMQNAQTTTASCSAAVRVL